MNGYIQIKIKDEVIGLKFAFPSVKWFAEAMQKAVDEKLEAYFVESIDEKGDAQSTLTDYGLAKLMQCAYRNNCLLKEEKPVLLFADFVEWVNDHNTEEGGVEMGEVLKVYAESSVNKKIIENAEKKSQPSQELKAV
jgi:hypothetical protein